MGAAIAATNAAALAERLRDLREALDAWLADLERPGGPDEAAIAARLRAARARLEEAPDRGTRLRSCPATAVPDAAGWYGLRTDGLEAFVAAVGA